MKAVEDISDSLNSLSQVISMSFTFAKSSPMKAKQSLTSCASYLQSKTFKSTSFVIRFWLVLIDLLKNEHVEVLVLSILSIIKQVIALLKMKESQIIITNALKVTASEPIAKLMTLTTQCIKSVFYIIKTPEIAKFQTQIWDLIEDELNTSNAQQTRGSNDEGYRNNDEEITEYNEESKHDANEDNASVTTNTSYLYPSRAWHGLTSMFAGYNDDEEENESVDTQDNKETDSQYVHTSKSHSVQPSMDTRHSTERRSRRTQSHSYDICSAASVRARNDEFSMKQHNRNIQCEYNTNNHNANRSGSVTVDDWVFLILYIDELEDGGEIQIHEGDELRKLAMDQHQSLLIVYKCYALGKRSRFLRYARSILKEQKQLKLLQKLEQERSMEATQSLDALHLSPGSIDPNDPSYAEVKEESKNENHTQNEMDHDIDNELADHEIACID